MKILFSPSESKQKGGSNPPFEYNSFIFSDLYKYRKDMIDRYQKFIDNADDKELEKLFGIKDMEVIASYRSDIRDRQTLKAVERYDGVAFKYLDYASLKKDQKEYIDKNVIIFSNLFGPILAGDEGLPDYKLKQGEKIGDLRIEHFYKEHFSNALDDMMEDEDILDLRAGFYEKFYKIKKSYVSLKFIKNGKVVSHWAKAYRGIVLRSMAKSDIKSIEEFMNLEIETLSISEILKRGSRTEICYEITE